MMVGRGYEARRSKGAAVAHERPEADAHAHACMGCMFEHAMHTRALKRPRGAWPLSQFEVKPP